MSFCFLFLASKRSRCHQHRRIHVHKVNWEQGKNEECWSNGSKDGVCGRLGDVIHLILNFKAMVTFVTKIIYFSLVPLQFLFHIRCSRLRIFFFFTFP